MAKAVFVVKHQKDMDIVTQQLVEMHCTDDELVILLEEEFDETEYKDDLVMRNVHPNKERGIILDNAGNLLRNGLPDDTYPTMLDDGKENQVSDKREQDEPKPKECPSCKFVKPPKTPVCPSCGFKAEIKSELEVTDGELVQIGKKANRKFTIAEKQEFIGGLKTYAYLHGYSDGWVAHTYKEFFSVWPNHPEIRHAPRTEINEATEKFIKYKQLRYHKGREKANKQA